MSPEFAQDCLNAAMITMLVLTFLHIVFRVASFAVSNDPFLGTSNDEAKAVWKLSDAMMLVMLVLATLAFSHIEFSSIPVAETHWEVLRRNPTAIGIFIAAATYLLLSLTFRMILQPHPSEIRERWSGLHVMSTGLPVIVLLLLHVGF